MVQHSDSFIPFNWPYMTGRELHYIAQCHALGKLAGDGTFTKRCHQWLKERFDARSALLTHSCTGALEMAAILLDIQPGDEVILPSYTFVSTANAFVLRGAIPVFVDIREDTLNLDESLIEEAITPRTRAIVPVHYAGVGCEMNIINDIARRHGLAVVEDAAQGVMASYKGRPLGSLGTFGTLSFHETKNLISGEGGALIVNDPKYAVDAEIIREKGTDRSRFSAARWINTPGAPWALPSCRANSSRLSCGRNSKRRKRSQIAGSKPGASITSCSRHWRPKGISGGRWCPRTALTMHICITSCSGRMLTARPYSII
jgi:dTDP-4-amino-4,6-dideoxygalactose transaminase